MSNADKVNHPDSDPVVRDDSSSLRTRLGDLSDQEQEQQQQLQHEHDDTRAKRQDANLLKEKGEIDPDRRVDEEAVAGTGTGWEEGGGEVRNSARDVEKGLVDADADADVPASSSSEKGEERDPFEVTWDGPDDKENPMNWNKNYRWFLTLLAGLMVLNSTFSSSAPSENLPSMIEYFGFSLEVGTLLISLFVAGYCAGPLAWGPLSEIYGRKWVFVGAFIPYTGFCLGCALSKNTASILVFRFLGGVFAACPLSNSGALISDFWDAKTRGIALSIFSLAPFAGPALGPVVGGFIEVTGTSWRWTFWVLTIFAGVCLVAVIALLPETYVPVILARKAARMRKETGDSRYWAPQDKKKRGFKELGHSVLLKPFIMLAQEPMLLAITLYMSYVYGIVYLLFEALPVVFSQVHGFNPGVTGLCFLPIFVGGALANLLYIFVYAPMYAKKADALAPKPVPPEERLWQAMLASCLLPVAMFWLGWTAYPSISYWSPLLAVGLLGACLLMIFLPLFNYMVDTYLMFAATALAANTVVRSSFGAGFPLFARQMYDKIGVHWASSLLAFIAILGAPIPFALYKFGPSLRRMSKNARDW